MIYSALGDSITYGYLASSQENHYVTRIQRELSKKRRVSHYLVAKPGWTSNQLLKSVKKSPKCIWDESFLITIFVGGNDMLRQSPWIVNGDTAKCMSLADKLGQNLAEMVNVVKRPTSKILVATVYNPFPNSLVAEECTRIINASVSLIASRENLTLVDVHKAFKKREHLWIEGYRSGQLRDMKFRSNPIHPNDLGHRRIANLFLSAYERINILKLNQQKGQKQTMK